MTSIIIESVLALQLVCHVTSVATYTYCTYTTHVTTASLRTVILYNVKHLVIIIEAHQHLQVGHGPITAVTTCYKFDVPVHYLCNHVLQVRRSSPLPL